VSGRDQCSATPTLQMTSVSRPHIPHDVACLLETDADLEGQARPAQTPLMPREDPAQTAGE
jgi:hypothetical protein